MESSKSGNVWSRLVVVLVLVCCSSMGAHAQTFAEWFNQKKTQTKYLIQQIAELKVYADLLNKGYTVAQKGLSTISDIKNGDFHLHDDYFKALGSVNPAISKMAQVGDLIAYQSDILACCKTIRSFSSQTFLMPEEAAVVKQVAEQVVQSVNQSIDLLVEILTDDKFQMKDNERIEQIEKLKSDVSDLYAFIKNYSTETAVLIKRRETAAGSNDLLKQLNGIR